MVCVWDAADPHKNEKETSQPTPFKRATQQATSKKWAKDKALPRASVPDLQHRPNPPSVIRQGDKTTYGTGPGVFHFWHALAFLAATDPRRASQPTPTYQPFPVPISQQLASSSYPHPYDPLPGSWVTPRWVYLVSPRYCKSRRIRARISSFGMSAPSGVPRKYSFPSSVPTGGVGRAAPAWGRGVRRRCTLRRWLQSVRELSGKGREVAACT